MSAQRHTSQWKGWVTWWCLLVGVFSLLSWKGRIKGTSKRTFLSNTDKSQLYRSRTVCARCCGSNPYPLGPLTMGQYGWSYRGQKVLIPERHVHYFNGAATFFKWWRRVGARVGVTRHRSDNLNVVKIWTSTMINKRTYCCSLPATHSCPWVLLPLQPL